MAANPSIPGSSTVGAVDVAAASQFFLTENTSALLLSKDGRTSPAALYNVAEYVVLQGLA